MTLPALPDGNLLLDSLTGAFPVVVFELDPNGVFLDERGAGRERILARYADSAGSPIGRSAFELYADAPQVVANLHRALAGEAFVGRVEVPRDGNTQAVFEVVYTPISDATGRLERLIGVALDVSEREAAGRQAIRDAERLRQFAARLQTERELERTRVARAVHDAVGQALTAIGFDTQRLMRLLDTDAPIDRPALRDRLADVAALVNTSLQAVGDLAAELRPPLLDSIGLSAALADTAARFNERTGCACHLEESLSASGESDLGRARATTAFRIVQEALTNVARHAGPCSVALRLCFADPTADELGELPERWGPTSRNLRPALIVEISDDGCGVADGVAQAGTPGLSGMAERAAQWGGTLYIGPPASGAGTLVRATIPLGPEPSGS